MTDAPGTPDLNTLLRNDAWMRRLAVRLVHDADDAEDLVQETLLVAVNSPPARPGRLDAWLRRVLRNLATHLGRREAERPARERIAARDKAGAARNELVQQVQLQRTLVDAVLHLQEPWQTAVLLRFYADMSAVEIGRQLNVPDATVRSWLHRALADLRATIERETGARGNLCGALLPLLRAPFGGGACMVVAAKTGGTALGAGGMLFMAAKTKVVIACVAVLLVAGSWWIIQRPDRVEPTDGRRAVDGMVASIPPTLRSASAGSPASLPAPIVPKPFRRPDTRAPVEVAAPPTRPVEMGRVRGVVLSARGQPVAGADVFCGINLTLLIPAFPDYAEVVGRLKTLVELRRADHQAPGELDGFVVQTDREGRFDLMAPVASTNNLFAFASEHGVAFSLGFELKRDGVDGLELRFPPGVELRGCVTDESGAPVPGVNLVVQPVAARLDARASYHGGTVTSDALGNWRTWPLAASGYTVSATLAGYQRAEVLVEKLEATGDTWKRVDLVLKRLPVLGGRLILADGSTAHLAARLTERFGKEAAGLMAQLQDLRIAATAEDPAKVEHDVPLSRTYGTVDLASDTWKLNPTTSAVRFVSLQLHRELIGSATIEPGQTQVDVVIDPDRIPRPRAKGVLVLRVRDRVDGHGIDGCRAVVNYSNLEVDALHPWLGEHVHVTADSGVARIPGSAGIWRVQLQAERYGRWCAEVVVGAGKDEALDVSLDPATASLSGIVVDPDGRPFNNAFVEIRHRSGATLGDSQIGKTVAVTNTEGRFRFPDLAPGTYAVVAFTPQPGWGCVSMRAEAGVDAPEARVAMQRACSVEFVFVGLTSAPLMRIWNGDGIPIWERKGPVDDSLKMPLAPGHYTTEVRASGLQPRQVEFDAHEGLRVPITMEK